jgi:hypothetical protein
MRKLEENESRQLYRDKLLVNLKYIVQQLETIIARLLNEGGKMNGTEFDKLLDRRNELLIKEEIIREHLIRDAFMSKKSINEQLKMIQLWT